MQRNVAILVSSMLIGALVACGGRDAGGPSGTPSASTGPLTTKNMPAVAGQQKTCGAPREKRFELDVIETPSVDLGMSTTFAAWTYNGKLPGPTLEACEGDSVTIVVHNKGQTSHGLDTHGVLIDARKYGPVGPGKTLTFTAPASTPGVFMYHCAAGPVTDLHIKSGIHGAMIVYPRSETLPAAREIVIVEDAVFGTRDEKGHIPGTDPARTLKNDQAFSMFNGRLDNDAVQVNAGDLVRIYFVNIGPGTSAAHVIGSVFERATTGGKDWMHGVQTVGVPAGGGAMLEFRIPQAGVFPFVDHDKLAFLPYGLSLPFATPGIGGVAH
jgi:nitrite reductase (NO-forming)